MKRAVSTDPLATDEYQSAKPTQAGTLYAQTIASHETLRLQYGCTLVAFLLPIKLSLTYIVLIPLILYWITTSLRNSTTPLQPRAKLSEAAQRIAAPLCAFLLVALVSSGAGLSLRHSSSALLSLFFFTLTIPLFAAHARTHAVCLALIAGQSIAALHSFIDAALPNTIPGLFLGKVTESGQLTITIPLTLGVILSALQTATPSTEHPVRAERWVLITLAVIVTATLTLVGFNGALTLSPATLTVLAFVAAGSLLIGALKARTAPATARQLIAIIVISLPLLICALLVNLKRGPWFGVLVGTSCLLLVYARRLILPLAASAVFLALSITPIRDRLLASYEHFTIEGGRSTIWRIGAELVSEYPLGIGYNNSRILREFAPEIPPELTHFHNNLLNITAETGWLGVMAVIWLLVAVVKSCFRDRLAPLYVAIGSAVISWQVAGVVEYNFGDSEVTILVWVLLGLVVQRELRG
jgi:hypothetical protein